MTRAQSARAHSVQEHPERGVLFDTRRATGQNITFLCSTHTHSLVSGTIVNVAVLQLFSGGFADFRDFALKAQ